MNCLFCGPKGKSFKHTAHIIPESMGNREDTLEGIECDKCNAHFSKLESHFVQHHLSSISRLFSVSQAIQILQAGRAERKPDGSIALEQGLIPGQEAEQFSLTFYANKVVLQASYFLQDADLKKLSRVLAKCALETLFLKKGDLAFSPIFDPLRRYARYGDSVPFVPFLWTFQNENKPKVVLCEITHKSEGVFFFSIISVPGCLYVVPCHRFDESVAINKLADRYSLNKVLAPGAIKRDPLKIEFTWAAHQDVEK